MKRVLVLGRDDVLAALPAPECAEVMAAALEALARDRAHAPLRSVMAPPGAAGLMGLMPAWRAQRGDQPALFAVKAVCVMPGNRARGLDAHQGTVTLFDGDTGVPTAILDASALTARRTAAVSAVATRELARGDARVLAILGAGVQAREHLRALPAVRSLEEVRVFAPTRAHARAALSDAPDGVRRVLASTAEQAVRGADVVVTATSSREPVLARAWLREGAHVNAVGASTPTARELDTATVAAAAIFVDSRESLEAEAGEWRAAVREGAIPGPEHVRASLGEVLAGLRPGRSDERELTLFRSLGVAVEDLWAASHAVAAARRSGLGTEVSL